jgi:hypothetical protein
LPVTLVKGFLYAALFRRITLSVCTAFVSSSNLPSHFGNGLLNTRRCHELAEHLNRLFRQ